MRNILSILLLSIIFYSCKPTQYVVNSNFYKLNRGLTKEQFINIRGMYGDRKLKPIGTFPETAKTFKHGNDIWEVWVFQIYNCQSLNGCYKDHLEYVAFKNNLLEEWGTGELPITIRQNPNQFQYDINIQNR